MMINQMSTELPKVSSTAQCDGAYLCATSDQSFVIFNNRRTPMSTPIPAPTTPVSVSIYSHVPYLWFRYPVAIAGHVVRSHIPGTGFFKLQLQCVVGLSFVLSLVGRWSCNLKKTFFCASKASISLTPMTMLLSPLHRQHRHTQQHPAAYSLPVASAGNYLPVLPSRAGPFK